jgi:hypothetical protein
VASSATFRDASVVSWAQWCILPHKSLCCAARVQVPENGTVTGEVSLLYKSILARVGVPGEECAPGYQGEACKFCMHPGYYRLGNKCTPCPKVAYGIIVGLALAFCKSLGLQLHTAVLWMVSLAVDRFVHVDVFLLSIHCAVLALTLLVLARRFSVNLSALGLGIDFLQVISLFSSFGFAYPEELTSLFSASSLSSFNEQLLAPECSLGTWSFSRKCVFA